MRTSSIVEARVSRGFSNQTVLGFELEDQEFLTST
jgi:hypothetical protein